MGDVTVVCYICRKGQKYNVYATWKVDDEPCRHLCGDCYTRFYEIDVPGYIPPKQDVMYRLKKVARDREKAMVEARGY